MKRQPFKRYCKICHREHYEGTSCIPKKRDNSHNINSIINDFTRDYPIRNYERTSRKSKKYSVQDHTRGEEKGKKKGTKKRSNIR